MYQRKQFLQSTETLLGHDGVLALLIVKCLRYRDINTVYGIKVGDSYLQQFEQRLQQILRPMDVVARIGDCQYGLLLPSLNNSAHALLAVNKIIKEFHRTFVLGDNQVEPRIVIGFTTVSNGDMKKEPLLQQAEMALLKAENGNEDYCSYDSAEDQPPPRLVIEQEMFSAYEQEEFSLYFQPKVNLLNHRVTGAEALLRWFSPKYGQVDTQYFIDILEDSRLLMPLTKWVLNNALRKCVELREIVDDFTVAVNLSPALLGDVSITDTIVGALKVWGLPPSGLMVEVTEGAMMNDPEVSMHILQQINSTGIHISIDDFGSGYSSLAYLRDLPVNELKIDRSFVINMRESRDKSIVKAAIDLAHALGLKVVAEGVETDYAMRSLLEMGCDEAQGYYMATPMPYDELVRWISDSPWGRGSGTQQHKVGKRDD
jgi:diguanylate cyclase (GGDEF)-like protein